MHVTAVEGESQQRDKDVTDCHIHMLGRDGARDEWWCSGGAVMAAVLLQQFDSYCCFCCK